MTDIKAIREELTAAKIITGDAYLSEAVSKSDIDRAYSHICVALKALDQMQAVDVDYPVSDVITWLEERRDNCLRIAEMKTDELDRAGWYLDAEEFQRAIDAISRPRGNVDIESLKRGPSNEDEAMCQVTSIYNDGWNHCIEELYATGKIK